MTFYLCDYCLIFLSVAVTNITARASPVFNLSMFQMLLNLHKKSWIDGLTLNDYNDHGSSNEKTVGEMLDLAKNYSKALEEEEKMTPEQLAIKNVGKQASLLYYYFLLVSISMVTLFRTSKHILFTTGQALLLGHIHMHTHTNTYTHTHKHTNFMQKYLSLSEKGTNILCSYHRTNTYHCNVAHVIDVFMITHTHTLIHMHNTTYGMYCYCFSNFFIS